MDADVPPEASHKRPTEDADKNSHATTSVITQRVSETPEQEAPSVNVNEEKEVSTTTDTTTEA
eukprot:2587851-Ditylum_brightwellii.AAC.1